MDHGRETVASLTAQYGLPLRVTLIDWGYLAEEATAEPWAVGWRGTLPDLARERLADRFPGVSFELIPQPATRPVVSADLDGPAGELMTGFCDPVVSGPNPFAAAFTAPFPPPADRPSRPPGSGVRLPAPGGDERAALFHLQEAWGRDWPEAQTALVGLLLAGGRLAAADAVEEWDDDAGGTPEPGGAKEGVAEAGGR
jgi:hypothetical protein